MLQGAEQCPHNTAVFDDRPKGPCLKLGSFKLYSPSTITIPDCHGLIRTVSTGGHLGPDSELLQQALGRYRSAIVYLRDQLGCRTISIEAGPSTVRDLYNDPVLVDELLLSVFHGKRVPDSVRGAPFIPSETVAAMFARTAPAFSLTEPSGPWRFHRLVRT